jgi:hypothetical protein
MKEVKLIFVFAIAVILSASGCQDNEGGSEEPGGTLTGEKISAKIDGVLWESTEAVAAYISVDKTLNLAGGNLNPGPNISAGIKKPVSVGTYNIIERGNLMLTLNNKIWLAGVNVFNGKVLGSGTITVTSIGPNDNIRGTFEAVVDDGKGNQKVITDGKFSGY